MSDEYQGAYDAWTSSKPSTLWWLRMNERWSSPPVQAGRAGGTGPAWRVSLAVVFVVANLCSVGCLTTNPARGVRANGEALSASNGRLRQGTAVLDEQDFYTIAGDTAAVGTIQRRRASLTAEQIAWQATGLAGIGGIVIGAGGLAAGIVVLDVYGPIGLAVLLPGVFLMTGSIVLVPLAYVWADEAADAMYARTFSTARAREAADRYNDRRRAPPRRRQGTGGRGQR